VADTTQTWGVEVSDVLALAPHVTVLPAAPQGEPTTDPDYGVGTQRAITQTQVEGFIADVASRVSAHRMSLVVHGESIGAALDVLAADAVKNGAAAYLVDAAFPARAGVNDSASYGQVLWARYQSAIDSMTDMANRVRDVDGSVPGDTFGNASGYFPPSAFPDGYFWR